MAPSVTFNVLDLNLNAAQSVIKVEGFFLSFFENMILNEFKTKVFAKIGEETSKYIETTMEEKSNTFLKEKGSHFYADGLGFDFS